VLGFWLIAKKNNRFFLFGFFATTVAKGTNVKSKREGRKNQGRGINNNNNKKSESTYAMTEFCFGDHFFLLMHRLTSVLRHHPPITDASHTAGGASGAHDDVQVVSVHLSNLQFSHFSPVNKGGLAQNATAGRDTQTPCSHTPEMSDEGRQNIPSLPVHLHASSTLMHFGIGTSHSPKPSHTAMWRAG